MGILGTIVKTAAVKSVIKTAGRVIVETTEELESRPKSTVKIGKAYDDFIGRDFREVQAQIDSYGFQNITLIPLGDTKDNWFSRGQNGIVSSISIDGNGEFKKHARFPLTAAVVIKYHSLME